MSRSMNFVFVLALLVTVITAQACRSTGHQRSMSVPSASSGGEVATAPPVARPAGKTFATPEEAMRAVGDAAGSHDDARITEIFGPGATDVLWSGDDIADKEAGGRVKNMIAEGVALEEMEGGRVRAAIGKAKWPFPIPLVRTAGGWHFDLAEGKEEVLSRRIGRNELRTIGTMYAYVAAQREYFAAGRDGNPPAYAQKLKSADGKHDGLYWPTAQGGEQSPFGELIAGATAAGYGPGGGGARPFHGYNYRILTGERSTGSGGPTSYVDRKGLMTGGYAAIAWPAIYGSSGIMTFVVNQSGIVFQKDLGPDTENLARAITAFGIDRSWNPAARP